MKKSKQCSWNCMISIMCHCYRYLIFISSECSVICCVIRAKIPSRSLCNLGETLKAHFRLWSNRAVVWMNSSVAKKRHSFYCNDSKIVEYEKIDTKISSPTYVAIYKLITLWVWIRPWRMAVYSLPWHWHILAILSEAGRGISSTLGLNDVFPPDDLGSGPEIQCQNMHYILWTLKIRSFMEKYAYKTLILPRRCVNYDDIVILLRMVPAISL